MSNYLFVEYTLNDPILSSTAIPFNNIKSQNGISYNDLTGENRFDEPGTNQVNWWVATQSSTAPNANFVLYHSDNGQTYVDQSCSPAKTGQTSGTAVFQVTDVPHTAYLRNESGQPFYFAQSVPVKASLTAFGIPSQGIALVPFGSIYVDSMVDSEEAGFYMGNPAFGGQAYSYYFETFPLSIDMEEFMEMQAFSVPKDGVLTGISGAGMMFSGEMGFDTYYLHAALYACPPAAMCSTISPNPM